MLCEESLNTFALGLNDKSPALTFKIQINEDGSPGATEIFLSWVKVTRLSYEQADTYPGLEDLFAFAEKNIARRVAAGAINIDLPEVHIIIEDQAKEIHIEPVEEQRSSVMVRECMLFAGEAAALWAIAKRLPFPFISQDPCDVPKNPLPGMAGSYQLRRCMHPRTLSTKPGFHFGLGLSAYTQVTSPLRRYIDLLAHQQIHAVLRGTEPIPEEELLTRIVEADAAAASVVRAERASKTHWILAYLSDKKKSQWQGIVLENRINKALVMIPALSFETLVPFRKEVAPNDPVLLTLSSVRIPECEAIFTSRD
jgi:exoribonuclease-2